MFNNSLLNKFNSLKTPFYYYDLDILKNNISELISSLEKNNKVHFALKSNSNKKLLELIKLSGIGIDAVSSNEIKRAIEVGFLPRDIVFAGVGKSDEEIHFALQNEISYLKKGEMIFLLVAIFFIHLSDLIDINFYPSLYCPSNCSSINIL